MQDKNLGDENSQLKEQILALQKKTEEQELIIDGLKLRTNFLEAYIQKQKSFIDNAMHRLNGIINNTSKIIESIESKKLKDRILGKFNKKKNSRVSDLSYEILEKSANIEHNYLSAFLTAKDNVGTTEDYLKDYIELKKSQPKNKDLDKETMSL